MTARSASGSTLSASAVEPATSQKRTVTVFRCSRGGSTASAAPQESQKRAPSRFSAPHLGQVTARTYLRRSRRAVSRTWMSIRWGSCCSPAAYSASCSR